MRETAIAAIVFLAALSGCVASGPATPPADGATNTGTLPVADVIPSLSWTSHATSSVPRTEVQAAALGKDIYVIGGFTGDGRTQSVVEVYDAAANKWSLTADYPVPIHHHAAVAVPDGANAGLYVFGGYTSPPVPSEQAVVPGITAVAFKYNPATRLWTAIAPLPEPRAAHAAAFLEGKIVIFGGISPVPREGLGLTPRVDIYDVATDTYALGADLPTPRDHLTAAAHGGRVYAIAGQQLTHDRAQGDFEVYDPGKNEWMRLAPVPSARAGLAGAVLDGRILALGGENGTDAFNYVEGYDPASGTWSTLPPLPTPRHGLGAAVWNGRAYALLGGPRFGLTVTGAVESAAWSQPSV